MEELLNKLIKKGWKPFGWDDKLSSLHKEYGVGKWYIRFHNGMDSELFDLRQLTSKESGLWQFCCENGMVKHEIYEDLHSWTFTTADHSDFWYTSGDNYEYRIIESALCNEDKLEDFILSNVKINE